MAMSKTGKVLLIVGGIVLAVFLAAIVGIALIVKSIGKPDVPENSVLVLKISGEMPDYAPEDRTAKMLGIKQPMSFTSLLTQLRKAKVDNRVGAILLDVELPNIGWGKADELRGAIKDFRASGKPIYSFMEFGLNKDYYVASATEKIFVPPAGDLYVNGLAAEAMFFRGSLDKLGVEPDFIKIGAYKTAPNQFTEKEMTKEQREVTNALLDEFYGRFKNAIAEDRRLSPENVEAIINTAPHHSPEAQQLKLIDGATYRDQVDEDLKTRLGYKKDDTLRTVDGNDYREVPADSLGLDTGEKIAVIYASGTITGGKSSNGTFGGETVGSETLVDAVNDAANDDSIKAIVLRVDSPGGSSLASDVMWHALENAKAKKPLVVSMSDLAASGGYYIACNANKIIAEPTTITGSIGVFAGKPVLKGAYDWLGVNAEYILRGDNAGIFRETEKWTDGERAKMTDQINKTYYNDFVPKVAQGRGKTVEEVNSIGQGHVWTGTQAKQNGLIDEFGGLEKAIEVAKNLANLPADKDVQRVSFPAPQSFFQRIFGGNSLIETKQQAGQQALVKSLPEDIRRTLRYAEMFDKMKNGETMMMMPFEITIK